MRALGRVVVLGAAIEVGCWAVGTGLTRGSWRYNVSALYAQGAPRPWIVMVGEAAFAIALAALALGLHRGLPASDFRWVASGLLALASAGALAGSVARNGCEESVPSCHGSTFATPADWVHGVGGLVEILGIAGAALVLVGVLPRPWSSWSAATAGVVLGAVLLSDAVPYPWKGTAQRIMILVIVGWAALVAAWVSSIVREPVAAREPALLGDQRRS